MEHSREFLEETLDNQPHKDTSAAVTGNPINSCDVSQLKPRQNNIELQAPAHAKTRTVVPSARKDDASGIEKHERFHRIKISSIGDEVSDGKNFTMKQAHDLGGHRGFICDIGVLCNIERRLLFGREVSPTF